MQEFYSNGKLLITGEYLVLDGAKSLAIPTKYGQDLVIEKIEEPKLIWKSLNENGDIWFTCEFALENLEIINSDVDFRTTKTLQKILQKAKEINPKFLNSKNGFEINTKLTFPKNWGLGTSSTLINNIANWAKIDAFKLLRNSFGGSGYDIACAQNNSTILYQLQDQKPIVEQVNFNPIFKDQLFFVYLNQKQDSRDAIAKYRKYQGSISTIAREISELTSKILKTKNLAEFEQMIKQHEVIISSIIKQKPVQKELFSDYFGQIKSLGAWGGDFILATGNTKTPTYFKNKGYETVISFQDMVL